MMYSKSLWIMIFFVAFVHVFAQDKKEELNALIDEAINVSPKIKMLKSKLNVASAKIEQGTNLPDPVLKIGLINLPTNSYSFTQEPMTSKTIGISQAIPYPGGLSAASEVKAIDTLIIQQEIISMKNEIKRGLSNLYYELQFTTTEINLNKERINLLKQILEVVKAKFEIAEVSMQNIIRVEVELTLVKDKIEKLLSKKNTIIAEMNAILLREETIPMNIEQIKMGDYKLVSPARVLELAEKNQPKLEGIRLSEEKSELMEKQAEYEFYPNFNIGIQYSQREYNQLTGLDYNDFLSVVAGITLPINYGGKKTAKVNEAKYLQNLYRENYNSTIQDLKSSINVMATKISELNNRYELISETLLPLAEQSLQIALSDYQVDKIDFVNVINAEKEILNVKTELYRIQTDYDQNIVKLEFLTGFVLSDVNQSYGDLK